MTLDFLIRAEGVLLLLLALLHIPFPRHFRWREDTASCQLLTRQILYVHCFFIGLIVGMMGLLCLTSAGELTGSPLGRKICGGLAVFWGCRLLIQFFGYSRELWRGKAFETAVHVVFALFWTVLTATFAAAALGAGT